MAAVSPEPSAVAQSTLTSRGPAATLTVNLITPSLSKAETSDIDISDRSLSITRTVAEAGMSKRRSCLQFRTRKKRPYWVGTWQEGEGDGAVVTVVGIVDGGDAHSYDVRTASEVGISG